MNKYIVRVNETCTCWYRYDDPLLLHREGGPAIEYPNGSKFWYQNDKLHRLDGPAVEYIELGNGYKEWYQNDKLHRLDGPAVEWTNGPKYWYIDGVEYSESEYLNKTTKKCSIENLVIEIEGKQYKLQLIEEKK